MTQLPPSPPPSIIISTTDDNNTTTPNNSTSNSSPQTIIITTSPTLLQTTKKHIKSVRVNNIDNQAELHVSLRDTPMSALFGSKRTAKYLNWYIKKKLLPFKLLYYATAFTLTFTSLLQITPEWTAPFTIIGWFPTLFNTVMLVDRDLIKPMLLQFEFAITMISILIFTGIMIAAVPDFRWTLFLYASTTIGALLFADLCLPYATHRVFSAIHTLGTLFILAVWGLLQFGYVNNINVWTITYDVGFKTPLSFSNIQVACDRLLVTVFFLAKQSVVHFTRPTTFVIIKNSISKQHICAWKGLHRFYGETNNAVPVISDINTISYHVPTPFQSLTGQHLLYVNLHNSLAATYLGEHKTIQLMEIFDHILFKIIRFILYGVAIAFMFTSLTGITAPETSLVAACIPLIPLVMTILFADMKLVPHLLRDFETLIVSGSLFLVACLMIESMRDVRASIFVMAACFLTSLLVIDVSFPFISSKVNAAVTALMAIAFLLVWALLQFGYVQDLIVHTIRYDVGAPKPLILSNVQFACDLLLNAVIFLTRNGWTSFRAVSNGKFAMLKTTVEKIIDAIDSHDQEVHLKMSTAHQNRKKKMKEQNSSFGGGGGGGNNNSGPSIVGSGFETSGNSNFSPTIGEDHNKKQPTTTVTNAMSIMVQNSSNNLLDVESNNNNSHSSWQEIYDSTSDETMYLNLITGERLTKSDYETFLTAATTTTNKDQVVDTV
jgi:hypothetical protein